jgi:hypothetical protein
VRYRGRWPAKAKLVIKRYDDKAGYLRQCRYSDYGVPTQFIIMPELGCIYAAGWDDTNILYYRDAASPRPSSNWLPKRACTACPSSPKPRGQVGQSAGVRSGKCAGSSVADAVSQFAPLPDLTPASCPT